MKIAVIGTGYVGLVTGACFAETGNDVYCVDLDAAKVDRLKRHEVPFYEPGLEDLVERNQKDGRLSFTTELSEALEGAKMAFICVGTPPAADGSADLSYVFQVAKDVAERAPKDFILITKSTVPVGTGDAVEGICREAGREDIAVCSNPEFLREGSAVSDALMPDRIVLGTQDETARKVMWDLYMPFVRTGKPILMMERRSAEMAKYGANALLACRISFINEVSRLCEKVDADVDEVRRAMGMDHRIGMGYLFPSVGFGGSCFPKDVQALRALAHENGVEPLLLDATLKGNELQKENYVRKLIDHFGGEAEAKGKRVAVWGLAFKAKTDDIRESPALFVIDKCLEYGMQVHAYDPEATENVKALYGDRISYADDMYAVLEGADALCLLTEWNQFRHPDFSRVIASMNTAVVVDGRNLFRGRSLPEGMTYLPVGVKA